jgi:predicted metal-binding membrane protein
MEGARTDMAIRSRTHVSLSRVIKLPQAASSPFAWILTFLFAGLAWILTYQQLFEMHFLPMYGTMGMPLGPFLFFWTIMMAAMMFPALSPAVSIQYTRPPRSGVACSAFLAWLVPLRLLLFLLGYLFVWCCFGLPVFCLGLFCNQLVLHANAQSVGLGIMLFVFAGIYQMTPLQRRCLAHCNPSLCEHLTQDPSARSLFSDLKAGVLHGIPCLGCCGNLMIVLIAVGLMNLFWMVLITLVIFIEKVWYDGYRLSSLIGMALIVYGVFSYINPTLLSGLYVH